MKYSRNIITESRSLICSCTEQPPLERNQTVIRTLAQLFAQLLYMQIARLKNVLALRRLLSRGAVQPQVNWLADSGRDLAGKRDFSALAGRGVACVERVHHDQSVLARRPRRLFAARTAREMDQFLRGAVVPQFFEHRVA